MRKTLAAVLLAATTLTAVSPAMAWGTREQGALIGAASVLGIQALVGALAPPVYVPAPVYAPPVYGPPVGYGYPTYPAYPVVPGPSYPTPMAVVPSPYIPPPGTPYSPRYRSVDMYFADCNCTRTVMVPDR